MPSKRKPETDIKEAASPAAKKAALKKPVAATAKQVYKEEVLGRQCLILFEVEDSESRFPYAGTVTGFEASLYLEQIVSGEEPGVSPDRHQPSRHTKGKTPKPKKAKVPAEARKPRRMKYRAKYNRDSWKVAVERLHLVVFEDGEELWLDLAELQAEGSLWWQDSEKDKAKAKDNGTTTSKATSSPGLTPPVTVSAGMMTPSMPVGMVMPGVGMGMMSPQQMAMMQQQWNNQMRMMTIMGTTPTNTPAYPTTAPAAAAATRTTPGEVLAAFASHHVWAGGMPGATGTPGTTAAAVSTETQKKRSDRPKGSKNKPKVKPTDTTATMEGPRTATTKATAVPETTGDPIPATETATTTAVGTETTTADAAATPKETPAKKKKPRPTPEGPAPSSGIPWIDDFRTFLETVPHGKWCRVASRHNASRIITYVKKLAMGEGISTRAWPVSFYKDVVVDMNMDMKLLKQHADEFQKQYGDPSNGWLLHHPMNNLVLYQEYKNDPEAYKKSVQEVAEEKAKKSSAASSSTQKKTKKASAKKSPKVNSGDSVTASEQGPSVNDPDIEKILRQAASEPEVAPQQQTAAALAQLGMAQAAPRASPANLLQRYVSPNQSTHATLARQAIHAMVANQAAPRSPPQGSVEWTDQFLASPHRSYAQAQGHQPQGNSQQHDNEQFPGGRGFSYY